MTEQNNPRVRATYRSTTHSIGVRVNSQQVANIPVAHLVALGALDDGNDLKSIRTFASAMQKAFKTAYTDENVDAVAIAEEYTGLTTISYDDYNKEGGTAAYHTFRDPFADVGLASRLASFNDKALAQIMPRKKEERPALPPTQIDPVVLAALTTQPG